MSLIIRSWHLANGLTVTVEDDTINYYGDYYNMRLSIRCRVEVKPEYLGSSRETTLTRPGGGDAGSFGRVPPEIVKAGIPGRDLAASGEDLLQKFAETALPYFERKVFPERFVQKRFDEVVQELSKGNRFDDRNGD